MPDTSSRKKAKNIAKTNPMHRALGLFGLWLPALAFTVLSACTAYLDARDKQWAIRALQPVIEALDDYYSRHQYYPSTLDEVIKAYSLSGIKVWPYGTPDQYTYSLPVTEGSFFYTTLRSPHGKASTQGYELRFVVGEQVPTRCNWTSLNSQWFCEK